MQVTSIDVRRDPIDITARSEPDPTWRYQDVFGQVHRWHGCHLPTLERRVEELCVDEDGEPYALHGWYVPATGERVEPGTRGGVRSFMPGLATVSGGFTSDERPDVDRVYRLEECGCGLAGEMFVTRWSRGYLSGEFEGDWVASGAVLMKEVADAT